MQFKFYTIIVALISLLPVQKAYVYGAPGDQQYPVSSIPEGLKKDADVVVRSEKTVFRIISNGRAIHTEELVVTILNPKGDRYTRKGVGYDKLSKIKTFEGALYAADGKLVRKLKKSDIEDRSAYDDVSFVVDNRYKAAKLEHKEYPFTIVWTTETERQNTMFYPFWQPPVSEKVAVEHAEFNMVCPQNLSFRHRTFGLAEPTVSTDKDGSKHYQWKSGNLKPAREEPLAYTWQSAPYVLTAPIDFEIEGYKGNMESWEQLGYFMNQLLVGRDALPAEVEKKIKVLTAPLASPREKIRAVYEYMQQNTRYLSIQLGIGGWQPFEASFVSQKGYGDCKALSNYTRALLKAIGITSHYAIISAGAENTQVVLEDFTGSFFNHVILCVPQEKDTIWLECTSQTNPFGHLGSFTGNRKALLVTEKGGKMVNTRYYKAADNFRNTKTVIDLQQGQPHYNVSRTYGGVQFDDPHARMRIDPQYQKNWLYGSAGLPDVSLKQYQLKQEVGTDPVMRLEAEGVLLEKLSQTGNRLFIPLALGKFPLEAARPVADRKTEFVQEWAYTYTDTLVYKLAAGFKPEHIPASQRNKTQFGEYVINTSYQDGELINVSTLVLYTGRYPAKDYADWVLFVQQLRSAHTAKAVLVQGP